jgi:lipopolysaccharide export system protein LptA
LATPSSQSPSQPDIKILSDQMDCDQSHNTCIAKGNATAEKLNDPKVKILKADQITAHFAKAGGTGPLKVTRLEATGNVFFIIGDIIIQGKRGNYLADSEVAEVFEGVKVTNGKNQLDGDYGTVNMKTGHYSLKGGGERVQALIFTDNKGKDAK